MSPDLIWAVHRAINGTGCSPSILHRCHHSEPLDAVSTASIFPPTPRAPARRRAPTAVAQAPANPIPPLRCTAPTPDTRKTKLVRRQTWDKGAYRQLKGESSCPRRGGDGTRRWGIPGSPSTKRARRGHRHLPCGPWKLPDTMLRQWQRGARGLPTGSHSQPAAAQMFQWRLGQMASSLRCSGGVLVDEVRIYCLEPTDSEVWIGSSERRGRSSALRARVVDASSVGMTHGVGLSAAEGAQWVGDCLGAPCVGTGV
jgi:hypothetical protein